MLFFVLIKGYWENLVNLKGVFEKVCCVMIVLGCMVWIFLKVFVRVLFFEVEFVCMFNFIIFVFNFKFVILKLDIVLVEFLKNNVMMILLCIFFFVFKDMVLKLFV